MPSSGMVDSSVTSISLIDDEDLLRAKSTRLAKVKAKANLLQSDQSDPEIRGSGLGSGRVPQVTDPWVPKSSRKIGSPGKAMALYG